MQTTKLYEILSSYNRYWTTGDIDAGIKRDLLPNCLGQLDSKVVVVLKGVRRCGKSTLMAQVIRDLLARKVQPPRSCGSTWKSRYSPPNIQWNYWNRYIAPTGIEWLKRQHEEVYYSL